jgi:hypothetical protein
LFFFFFFFATCSTSHFSLRRRCGFLGIFYFDLLAALFFVIPSIGFVGYDLQFGILPSYCSAPSCRYWHDKPNLSIILTVVWSAVYVFDSVIFFLALIVHDRANAKKPVFFLTELGNFCGSFLVLCSQLLYYLPAFLDPSDLNAYGFAAFLQSLLYFVAIIIWFVNSIQYFFVYLARRAGNRKRNIVMYKDIGFWCEISNILPSFGFLITALYGFIVILDPLFQAQSIGGIEGARLFSAVWNDTQQFQISINLGWDSMFLLSGLLHVALWTREARAEQLRKEAQETELQKNIPLLEEEEEDEEV